MTTANVQAKRGLEDTRVTNEPLAELPQPPSRRPYGPGDSIEGRYELEALIGKGGMGEVWTARNDTLGVRRAIKLISADADSVESTDRLLHEARAAAGLADPAIVRVFDFGKTEWGDPYIVMELLEGEDLMSIINRRERLSPAKAVRVLLPVIRALGAAHAHGIVHRDLKPENIFLAKQGDGHVQPKLLDFGIAKLRSARELRLTSAGAVVGSPLYMAPEQGRGEDVDERADVWALSVVLYEAITGSLPFNGENRSEVMHAVTNLAPKDLSAHGINEPDLWSILKRGLAKAREDRFPSMIELGRALARWLQLGGVNDDITGASLEAGWFRSSRRSLFASSLPPASGLQNLQQRVKLAARDRRWLIAVPLLLALGVLIWRARSERGPEFVPAPPPPRATARPSTPPAAPVVNEPAPATSNQPARTPAAQPEAAPSAPPAARSPSKRPSARSSTRSSTAKPETSADSERRPKLIDPYQ